jgi:Transposase, Mutator family
MPANPRHRPVRRFPDAPRQIVDCPFTVCLHCGGALAPRRPWHTRKTVQTLAGPLFVAGKSKECVNTACAQVGMRYYASPLLAVSLPHSTYGLDVLAFVGWQHEHEHRQLVEIQRLLNARGVLINERSVGKVYRQFLALLGGLSPQRAARVAEAAAAHGGVVWAVDALQPEGDGTLLYVLYEAVSGTPVSALSATHASAAELHTWLHGARQLPYRVLATLSDGEAAIGAALRTCWPNVPHQRCQVHFLNNIAAPVLEHDVQLRRQMRAVLGDLDPSPSPSSGEATPPAGTPPLSLQPLMPSSSR